MHSDTKLPASESVVQFWDERFSTRNVLPLDQATGIHDKRRLRAVQAALAHFGDVHGRTLLDIGCGTGATSCYFAKHGANVIAADTSPVALEKVAALARSLHLDNVTPVLIDHGFFGPVKQFDHIFGAMILHHIEPFDEFVEDLHQRLGVSGFFFENSAVSNLLIWFRSNIVGKLWVKKVSDDEEFPLTPAEVGLLKKLFKVEVEIPELVFFQLGAKLFGGLGAAPLRRIDKLCFDNRVLLNRSYHQFIRIAKQ